MTCPLFYPAKLGGPANTLYWLSKALVRTGIDVTVVTSSNYIDKKDVEFDKWIEVDKIRVRYCTTKSKLSLRVIYFSMKEMRKCDVVLFSSICYLPNFFLLISALLFGLNVVWSPRGELFDYAVKNNKFKLLYFKLLKFIVCKKILFHATSNEEKVYINKYFPEASVVVIPNYMELPLKVERNVTSVPYLLYMGRIAPIKALDSLILGLADSKFFLTSKYVFFIVGNVEKQFLWYYEKLNGLIKCKGMSNKIQFVGPKYGVEKYQYYANAYFSFLVSNSENFGNVVIESLSQGTPVVASEGTPWRILKESNAGFWIKNDIDSVSRCIDDILRMDKEEYQKYRENAYLLSKQFDVNFNIATWKVVFENVIRD